MVLPASPPADAYARDAERWVQRILRQLALTKQGILLLVDNGQPWQLQVLLERLVDEYPEIEVYTKAAAVAALPTGSTAVFVPDPKDAYALNMGRPLFSRHELRVVLFCETAVSHALRRDAPDFFDWISLVVQCPPSQPPHIVEGLRMALDRNAGVAWMDDRPDATQLMCHALNDIFHADVLKEINLNDSFAKIVKEIKLAKDHWLWAHAKHELLVHRFRWGLAAARRKSRAVVIVPERLQATTALEGFYPVRARERSIAEIRRRFFDAGARRIPGRLAAWTRGDPDRVDFLEQRLRSSFDEMALERDRDSIDTTSIAKRSSIDIVPYDDPARMALQAFELGDDDAGNYLVKRALRRLKTQPYAKPLREQLLQWADLRQITEEIPKFNPLTYPTEENDDFAEFVENKILVDQLIKLLPDDDQKFIRKFLADFDEERLARELGQNVTTIGRRLKDLGAQLHRLLEENEL
ncbi:MAG TPA: hypothetical protein PK156_38910 [Polyangium sp.]|nr:hypothetical protein [Polyangium sp.]